MFHFFLLMNIINEYFFIKWNVWMFGKFLDYKHNNLMMYDFHINPTIIEPQLLSISQWASSKWASILSSLSPHHLITSWMRRQGLVAAAAAFSILSSVFKTTLQDSDFRQFHKNIFMRTIFMRRQLDKVQCTVYNKNEYIYR